MESVDIFDKDIILKGSLTLNVHEITNEKSSSSNG